MKHGKVLVASLVLAASMSSAAFAGEWKQDSIGWWYQNDDGSYPVNQWLEVDGKQYYFNESGYMLSNTITPDGKQVGADGALIVSRAFPTSLILRIPLRKVCLFPTTYTKATVHLITFSK